MKKSARAKAPSKITFTLPVSTANKLEEKAKAAGLSVSAYVEQLLVGDFVARGLMEARHA